MTSALLVISMLLRLLQAVLVPLCLVVAWLFTGLMLWSLLSAVRDGIRNSQRMHQIPCARCEFFTGDYRLKCTVHPSKALTEEAIHCSDYEAKLEVYASPYLSHASEPRAFTERP